MVDGAASQVSFRDPLAGRRQRAHAGSHDLADEILREIADDARVCPGQARCLMTRPGSFPGALVGNHHHSAIAALSLRAGATCITGRAGVAGIARGAGVSSRASVARGSGVTRVTCVTGVPRRAGVAGATGIAGVARSAGIARATHVSLVALCAGVAGIARISRCTWGSSGTCATGHGEHHE